MPVGGEGQVRGDGRARIVKGVRVRVEAHLAIAKIVDLADAHAQQFVAVFVVDKLGADAH